jgi:hypothetical protein
MRPLHKRTRDTDRDFMIDLCAQTLSFVQNGVEGQVGCCSGITGHGSRHLRKSLQPLFSSTTLPWSGSSDLFSRRAGQLLREFAESGCNMFVRSHRATFGLSMRLSVAEELAPVIRERDTLDCHYLPGYRLMFGCG